MARRLTDIENEIRSREKEFVPFLKNLLEKEVYDFLTQLKKLGPTYLFSGIIRDFFLGYDEIRDVDIMIHTNKDISTLLSKFKHRKNSFGGFKIYIANTVIDLWYLQDTWGLKAKKVMELDLVGEIPKTAFFNFSAILFSFKNKNFIYTKHFLRFLRDRKIDYVFAPNANKALCVVNTFYYRDKLKLPIADRLKLYLKKLDISNYSEYENVQLKHFGKVLYSVEFLRREIKNMVVEQRKRATNKTNIHPELF